MATTQTHNGGSVDSAFEQVKDSSEQFMTAARKVGNLYLDSYDKIVDSTVDFELKLAELSKQEWLKSVIETQAKLAHEYATAARSFIK
jgi:hypothetical protein